ncbi:MAG: leucine-rich repeat protein [Clostridia bacterium]|nr:leucine-rich repeat protein [Clostridia bacterium]
MKKTALCLFFTFLALMLVGCTAKRPEPDLSVRVLLRMTEEATGSASGMVLDVTPGSSAVFDLSGSGFYPLEVPEGASFDEETLRLTVSRVRAPMTLDMPVIAGTASGEKVKLLTYADAAGGTVVFAKGASYMTPGVVTVRAETKAGYTFAGWSQGGYLSGGGTLVSTSESYTFFLSANSKLYANFKKHSYTIIYHTGEGKVAATGQNTYTVTKEYSDQFAMQQTVHENGTFTRAGYVAVGYSTQQVNFEDYADCNAIPGFCNLGGVCSVPETTDTLDLYVVWAKETPASDFTVSGSAITKYKGTAKTLVIPSSVGGKTITSVSSGAVSGNLTRVVIPPTVKTLADGAFTNCPKLSEVVFFDSVQTLSDASFASCPEIRTVVLNSQRLPRYATNYEGLFCIKYERLCALQGKKLIAVSGSSSLEGFLSADVEKAFPEYQVINFGTIVPYSAVFQLDVISNHLSDGDLVVFAPEYMMAQQMGSVKLNGKIFRGFEMCYDVFREVDMRKYTGFFTAFRDFQNGGGEENIPRAAISMSPKEYQTPFADMNKYGDYTIDRTVQKVGAGSGSYNYSTSLIQADKLNEVYHKIRSKGGEMVMTFCPFDASAASAAMKNESASLAFAQSCRDLFDFEVISVPLTYIMDHSFFYDSFWHLSEKGAAIRTDNLIADLKKYFGERE